MDVAFPLLLLVVLLALEMLGLAPPAPPPFAYAINAASNNTKKTGRIEVKSDIVWDGGQESD